MEGSAIAGRGRALGWARGASVAAVVLGLALGGLACGGSDDGDGGSGASATEASSTVDAATDRKRVAATMTAFYNAVYDFDAEAYCGVMTETNRRNQTLARSTGKPCEEAYGEFFDTAREAGGTDPRNKRLEPDLSRVKIEGDIATVTRGRGITESETKLIREGDEWKIATTKEAFERSRGG